MIIHSGQEQEATQVSPDWWMREENVVCTCKGTLFNLQKEIPSHATNVDELWDYVEWNKPDMKGQIVYESNS